MTNEPSNVSRLWAVLERYRPKTPDTLVVGVGVFVAHLAMVVFADGSPLRILLVTPLLLFFPGYALLAIAYPFGADSKTTDLEAIADGLRLRTPGCLTLRVRFALSFGLSVVVLSVIALTIVTVTGGLTLRSLRWSLTGVVLLGMSKRILDDRPARYRIPFEKPVALLGGASTSSWSRGQWVVNGIVVLLVLASIGAFTATLAASPRGDQYTSLAILTKTDSGELISGDYPETLEPNESTELYARISNHEGERTEYTLVGALQRTRRTNESFTVVESERLFQRRVELDSGESTVLEQNISADSPGSHLRVVYFLYRGDPPARLQYDEAYRSGHIWINVAERR